MWELPNVTDHEPPEALVTVIYRTSPGNSVVGLGRTTCRVEYCFQIWQKISAMVLFSIYYHEQSIYPVVLFPCS